MENKNYIIKWITPGTQHSSRETQKILYVSNTIDNFCPCCAKRLRKTALDFGTHNHHVKYPVYSCGKHYFVYPSNKLRKIMLVNPNSEIKTNFKYYYHNYNEIAEIFQANENHIIMFLLKSKRKKQKLSAIIIANYSKEINDDIRIVNYTDLNTRLLLTQVYKFKEKALTIEDEEYELYKIVCNVSKCQSQSPNCILKNIIIKDGGGYYSSIKNGNYEIVDVLLYSPYKKRYEISRATYNKLEDEYFMDIRMFKKFYTNYGNPQLNLYNERSSQDYNYILNEESMLHSFGYNVGKYDDLSDNCRCEILSDFMDLEIANQKYIINLLEGNLRRQKNRDGYESACSKWEHDINFVINYKVNPERFIIKS